MAEPSDRPDGPERPADAHPSVEIERALQMLVGDVEDYAIFLLDPTGRIASWNAGARRIKQYEPADILGKHFSRFYMPDAVAKGWPDYELRMAAKHGRFTDEGWRVRKDGSRFWASIVITALKPSDKLGAGFLKITRDLTDRRQAEETLRESEERFRLLIEGVREYAIFMLSPEGLVQSWNSGAERVTGYRSAEIVGRHFSALYPPEGVASGEPARVLQTATREGSLEEEGWRIRKNGTGYWASVVLTALIRKDGSLQGFAVITRDTSDRRRVDELLRADRKRNEFLALLTRELRNPLAPIRNALHVLAQPAVDPATAAKVRDIAWRQVDRMARLLDDLLDVTQIAEGRITLRPERVDVSRVLAQSVDATASFLTERHHHLIMDLPDEPLWSDADPARLEQVFVNLLMNAARFTEPGGRITVTARREARRVVVRVRDTGIGIDPLMASSIFDPFMQAERPLDRPSGGVGIGLTLVRRLVELHEGTVEVISAGKGKGSEFVVSLRAAERPSVPPRPRLSPPFGFPKSLKVLVVDDNVDAANSLAMALRLSGQQVRVAHDGETALALASQDRPEAVLLDIAMPGMDGYELARRLRRAPATRKSLLVALTCWAREEDKRKAHEAGFDHHLVKPVDPTFLGRIMAAYPQGGDDAMLRETQQ